jgi:hypothetical protein
VSVFVAGFAYVLAPDAIRRARDRLLGRLSARRSGPAASGSPA